MKKRILKIAAFVAALALIFGVAWFANGLIGNPISRYLAARTAEQHLKEAYADTDFEVERVMFNFKNGCYNAFIVSPRSADSSFNLLIDPWGRLLADSYTDRVLGRGNTADRIGRIYREQVDAVLDSPSFPYCVGIGYGELAFASVSHRDDPSVPPYAIPIEELTLDGFYDVSALGATAGQLTLYLEEETVSVERLSEILLDVRHILDEAGVSFYTIDCVLEYPKPEQGGRWEGRVEVMNFLCSEIYEEGMEERVRASDEAAKAYYAAQDTGK